MAENVPLLLDSEDTIANESCETTSKDLAAANGKTKKICKVCGDCALGYNFNAITCESCKAFFRRNALKDQDKFKCPFNGKCKIDVVTRRFCQKCRLDKCLSLGMKKEWIMTDDDKRTKRHKSDNIRHRRKRFAADGSSLPRASTGSISTSIPTIENSNDVQYGPLSSSDLHTFTAVEVPSIQSFCMSPQISNITYLDELHGSHLSIDDKMPVSNEVPCSYNTIPKNIKVERTTSDFHVDGYVITYEPTGSYTNLDSIHIPSSTSCLLSQEGLHHNSNDSALKSSDLSCNNVLPGLSSVFYQPVHDPGKPVLDEYDSSRIEELLAANRIMIAPPDSDWKIENNSLLDVINLTNSAVRRMIKMAKKMGCFRNLGEDDQVALLKGGCTELMILRSVMAYDSEKECWPVPDNPINLNVLKQAKGNVYEEHKKYINSYKQHLREDEIVMLIVTAIRLFCPTRPNLVSKKIIAKEQNYYQGLLKRYLETKYAFDDAQKWVDHLLQKLTELHELNENHVRVFLDVNPKDVEPLIIELFDLKPR